jgi:RNA polymerase sigma factor (sigma-70 family)
MDAFWLIYERYNRDVYRFALFLTGDPVRADDLVSDTFVRAWTARERIRQETVKGYLLTIARNLHRDQVRATRRLVELEETIEDEAPGVDVQVEQRGRRRRSACVLRFLRSHHAFIGNDGCSGLFVHASRGPDDRLGLWRSRVDIDGGCFEGDAREHPP